jgi:hypothetical protein
MRHCQIHYHATRASIPWIPLLDSQSVDTWYRQNTHNCYTPASAALCSSALSSLPTKSFKQAAFAWPRVDTPRRLMWKACDNAFLPYLSGPRCSSGDGLYDSGRTLFYGRRPLADWRFLGPRHHVVSNITRYLVLIQPTFGPPIYTRRVWP